MKQVLTLVLLLSLVSVLPAPAAAVEAEASSDYASLIDVIAKAYIGKTVPGACVIVAEHGEVIFSKSYGYADIDKQTPIELDSTVFEWGSITKTFVWVSVMQQVEAGRIDLNQDIRAYLPDGFLKNLCFDTPITMLHLMNHTAGFAEQLFDLRYQEDDVEQPLENILSVHQPEQVFEPGTVCAYSNWGAALAALIVERVSGQDFAEYLKENILAPLSMNQTAVRPQWNDNPLLLERKATGYSYSGTEGIFHIEDWMRFCMYPAGSINGTALDLLKYANELAKGERKTSLLFQKRETQSEMLTETYRSFGANAGMAHGFWQYPNASGILGHEGGTYGFKTQFWVDPQTERVIVVMTNVMETDFCSKVMQALVDLPSVEAAAQVSSQEELRSLEGDYFAARSSWGNIAEIQGRIQAIQISAIADGQLRLRMPFGSNEYIFRQTGAYQFYCANASPEEQVLAFSVKDGSVAYMSFRLAHDYIPVSGTQGIAGTIAIVFIYVLCLLYWLVILVYQLGSLIFKKMLSPLWKWIPALCGLLLGISGLIGLIHWFPTYTVSSAQLNIIVRFNWICGVIAAFWCFRGIAKKKFRHAGIMLAVLVLQLISVYQIGFFTLV